MTCVLNYVCLSKKKFLKEFYDIGWKVWGIWDDAIMRSYDIMTIKFFSEMKIAGAESEPLSVEKKDFVMQELVGFSIFLSFVHSR